MQMARKRKIQATQSLEPSESAQPSDLSKKISRTRGASLLKGFTKLIGEGKRIEISFNNLGQPKGDNVAKLSTYIGAVTKRIVPITIENWKLVSDEDLDHIWDDVVVRKKIFINNDVSLFLFYLI